MKPRDRIPFPLIARAGWPVALLLLITSQVFGQHGGVVSEKNVTKFHRRDIATKLQKITGFTDLQFDNAGALRIGNAEPVGGSPAARSLVRQALASSNVILIEDVSRDLDVVFARVLPARWKEVTASRPPAFVIQIDFADFANVTGDQLALEAFDVGWVMLHELDHIVNGSTDAKDSTKVGDCEEHINIMRRECNLPLRGAYFSTLLPTAADSVFAARFVRLAFEKQDGETNRKYWLVWDARLVGGLGEKQIASVR